MLKTRAGATVGTQIDGTLDPISVDIRGACRLTGIGRSKLYELLISGEVPSVKVGKRRVVPVAGLRAWLDKLAAEQRAAAS
jgi:excisionase family DNA binding protein